MTGQLRDERGMIAVLVMLLLPALVGILALVATDGVRALTSARVQAGADAAALAVLAACEAGDTAAAPIEARFYIEANTEDRGELESWSGCGDDVVSVRASLSFPDFFGGRHVVVANASAMIGDHGAELSS